MSEKRDDRRSCGAGGGRIRGEATGRVVPAAHGRGQAPGPDPVQGRSCRACAKAATANEGHKLKKQLNEAFQHLVPTAPATPCPSTCRCAIRVRLLMRILMGIPRGAGRRSFTRVVLNPNVHNLSTNHRKNACSTSGRHCRSASASVNSGCVMASAVRLRAVVHGHRDAAEAGLGPAWLWPVNVRSGILSYIGCFPLC